MSDVKLLLKSPESAANMISKLTFAWPTKLMSLAKQRTLQPDDLWSLPDSDQAAR